MKTFFIAGLLIMSSCSFFTDSVCLKIQLPVLPEAFNSLYSGSLWQLSVFHEDGCTHYTVSGLSAEIMVPAFKSLSLTATPQPLVSEIPQLLPCGVFLQAQHLISDSTVSLTWSGGVMAELFTDKNLLSLSPGINTARIQEGINERCSGNPWALDFYYLRETMSAGTTGYYDIRKQAPVIIHLPEDCNYITNNALSVYCESVEKEITVYGSSGYLFTESPVTGWIEFSQGPYDMIVIQHDLISEPLSKVQP